MVTLSFMKMNEDPEDLEIYLSDEYPLHKASRAGRLDIIKALVRNSYNVNQVNFDLVTPLHEACFHGHLHCANFLIEKDAVVDARNIDGSTPLCEASAMGRLECVRLLLKNGAKVNPPLALCSPLHEAVIRGQASCASMLIDSGAKLDISDCHFGTPLHAACYRNSVPCALVLLRAGAAVNATKIHRTALHIAANHNYEDLTHLLLEFGANVFLQDNQGKRPRELAPPNSTLSSLLLYYEQNPRTLMNLSKLAILHHIGPRRLSLLYTLGLPHQLQSYIKYE